MKIKHDMCTLKAKHKNETYTMRNEETKVPINHIKYELSINMQDKKPEYNKTYKISELRNVTSYSTMTNRK